MRDSALTDKNWRKTALIAALIFVAGYVLPALIFGADSGFTALLQVLASLASFAFAVSAVFYFLQGRSAASAEVVYVGEIAADGQMPASLPASSIESAPVATPAAPAIAPIPALVPWSIERLEALDEEALRSLCLAFYREKGFACELQEGEHAGLVLCRSNEPVFTAVLRVLPAAAGQIQADGVHELIEARGALGASKSFLVAMSGFADRARTLAKGTQVTLIDGKLLLNMVSRLPPDAQGRIASHP